ncbi:hypothetical protein LTS18_009446, partial [Coniosporium uncinatum]
MSELGDSGKWGTMNPRRPNPSGPKKNPEMAAAAAAAAADKTKTSPCVGPRP